MMMMMMMLLLLLMLTGPAHTRAAAAAVTRAAGLRGARCLSACKLTRRPATAKQYLCAHTHPCTAAHDAIDAQNARAAPAPHPRSQPDAQVGLASEPRRRDPAVSVVAANGAVIILTMARTIVFIPAVTNGIHVGVRGVLT